MERLFYYPEAGPTPVPRLLHGAEAVSFQSADGTKLHGWFIPAQSDVYREAASGLSPTVLHVHGNAGNIKSHVWFTEYLPPAGFNVFIFDYRGYGQSEGRVRGRGPLIADTEAALDAILVRSDVDPKRIGVYGQSLGGAIALNVMAKRPEIRAAVIESSFASWRDEAADVVGGWIGRVLATILISDSHRPEEAVASIRRPMLLMHGTADRTISIEHSRRLAAAAGAYAILLELPGGDHNTLRESHPAIDGEVIDFFQQHLGR